MPTPTVSVVIPSYRRKSWLLKTLDCLASQSVTPIEAVVVDASPDGEALTTEDVRRYPEWLRYVRWEEPGCVTRQRNAALRTVRGDVVLFLDDDVEFGPGLIADYLDAFRETGAHGISGLVLLPGEQPASAPKTVHTDPIRYPGAPNYQAYDGVVDTHVICTASFAARRDALEAVGGFDEQIYGTLDDVELGLRLMSRGFRIVHHNRPRVLHFMAPASGSRSADVALEWTLANMFYFQFRHYWGHRRLLLARTLWDLCRPSRHWARPAEVWGRWRATLSAYGRAARRADEGPRLLKFDTGMT